MFASTFLCIVSVTVIWSTTALQGV